MDQDEAPTLGELEFFAEVPKERIAAIDRLCTWKYYEADEVILDLAPNDDALFMVGGDARVVFQLESGEEIKVANVGPYDVVGALSAIDEEPRSAVVIANGRSCIARMPRTEFRKIVAREPGVALHLLKRFGKIIRGLNARVRDLSLITPEQRLYGELLRLARPNDGDAPFAVADMPNHEELAGWANTTRDVVAFAIGALARRGIVERKHKTLYIRDPQALRDLAGMAAAA